MLAVIETGGKQYLVKEGDSLTIEKIPGVRGAEVIFDAVLLLAEETGAEVQLGTPYLQGVTITATLEKQFRDKKITIVKFKRKVRYRRKQGHRQEKTKVKVLGVQK